MTNTMLGPGDIAPNKHTNTMYDIYKYNHQYPLSSTKHNNNNNNNYAIDSNIISSKKHNNNNNNNFASYNNGMGISSINRNNNKFASYNNGISSTKHNNNNNNNFACYNNDISDDINVYMLKKYNMSRADLNKLLQFNQPKGILPPCIQKTFSQDAIKSKQSDIIRLVQESIPKYNENKLESKNEYDIGGNKFNNCFFELKKQYLINKHPDSAALIAMSLREENGKCWKNLKKIIEEIRIGLPTNAFNKYVSAFTINGDTIPIGWWKDIMFTQPITKVFNCLGTEIGIINAHGEVRNRENSIITFKGVRGWEDKIKYYYKYDNNKKSRFNQNNNDDDVPALVESEGSMDMNDEILEHVHTAPKDMELISDSSGPIDITIPVNIGTKRSKPSDKFQKPKKKKRRQSLNNNESALSSLKITKTINWSSVLTKQPKPPGDNNNNENNNNNSKKRR